MGRNQDDISIGIVYDVDTVSLNEAAASAEQVSRALVTISGNEARLIDSSRLTSIELENQSDVLRQLRGDAGLAADEIENLGDSFGDAKDDLDDLDDGATRLSQSPLFTGRVAAFAERVGLDPAAEALRAGRGGIEAAEAFRSIGPAITETTDAAKRAFESASEALGMSPAGLGGVAIVATAAIAATTLVLSNLIAESRKAAEAERIRISVLREATQLAAQGETAQDALNRAFEAGIDVHPAKDLVTELEQDLREGVDAIGGRLSVDPLFDPLTSNIEELEEIVGRFAFGGELGGPAAARAVTILDELRAARLTETEATERQNQAIIQSKDLLGSQNEAMAAARREAELFEQTQRLLATGTSEAVESLIVDNDLRREALDNERRALEAIEEPGAAVQARLFDIGVEMDTLQENTASLVVTMGELAERERQLAEVEERRLAIEEMRRVGTELSKQADLEAFEAEQENAEKLAGLRERMVQERLRGEEESLAAVQEMAKKRADIEKKLTDQIISITEKAADAAHKTRLELERELAALPIESERDLSEAERDTRREELKLTINDQRQTEKDLRQHLHRMQKLRRDSEAKEAELIQARDFRGLFNLRRNTRRQIQGETESFASQNQERQIALAQERADLAQQHATLRAERMIELKQEINDAHAAASQRLGDINRQRNLELARLQQAANQQLALLVATEQTKVGIVQKGASAVNNALRGMFAGLPSASTFRSAFQTQSNTSFVDKSVNTFNTGANAKDVRRIIDDRVIRNLRVVLSK